MESHVIDAAQSLRRQFDEASARWPNLTSVLVLWPDTDPEPEIPAALTAPQEIYEPRPDSKILWWKALYGERRDTPEGRYRSGSAGQLSYWRKFGKFSGENQIKDNDIETEC